MNTNLKKLLELAKSDGVTKNEKTKSNLYKSVYFENVTNEREEKKIRRTLRDLSLSYLQNLISAKDKKEFSEKYKKFEIFFADTYNCEKVDFSVFDGLRKENAIKLVENAKKVCEKYNK